MDNLQVERDFLSDVLDNVEALVVVFDKDGQIVRINQACERLFGYTADEIKLKLHTGFLSLPNEFGTIKSLLKNLRTGKDTERFENQWLTNDGKLRTIIWSITALFDQNGAVEFIMATGIDITDREQAMSMLKREQSLLQSLINSIPDLVFYKDRNSRYLGCNYAFEKFTGRKAEEIIGQTDLAFYPADLAAEFFASDQRVLSSGTPYAYENWTKNRQGEPVLIETRKTPCYGPDGEVLGVIGIGRDITQHHMVENALRKSTSEFVQLIDSLSSVLIVLSLDGRVTQWNRRAQRLFGLPSEVATNQLIYGLPIRWNVEAVTNGINKCREKSAPIFLDPMKYTRLDGQEGYLGLSISPMHDSEGPLSGFILLCSDITERKITDERQAQSRKLESIGQLAAGIAHEINTPVQYIGDNTTFLQNSFQELIALLQRYDELFSRVKMGELDPALIDELDQARTDADLDYLAREIPVAIQQSLEGVHRVSEIVRAMKEFSHPGVKEKTALDINHAIQHTLTVSRNEWKYVAEVETDLDPELPKIICLPGEINQVFLNLIVNAAQAIALQNENGKNGKGTIRIQTRKTNDWIEIRVSDTGSGIADNVKPHIFEPFFTTKEVGKGTGQGLAIAYDVIERKHGGSITFETEVGVGTTFIVKLPTEPLRKMTGRL
jgi:PAS domain S-box-containing protein